MKQVWDARNLPKQNQRVRNKCRLLGTSVEDATGIKPKHRCYESPLCAIGLFKEEGGCKISLCAMGRCKDFCRRRKVSVELGKGSQRIKLIFTKSK